jgi:hypothetical protein
LSGNHFYCVTVESDNLFCRDVQLSRNNATPFSDGDDAGVTSYRRPKFCRFESDPVLMSSVPWLGQWLPMCDTHFSCAWVYIAAAGSIKLFDL